MTNTPTPEEKKKCFKCNEIISLNLTKIDEVFYCEKCFEQVSEKYPHLSKHSLQECEDCKNSAFSCQKCVNKLWEEKLSTPTPDKLAEARERLRIFYEGKAKNDSLPEEEREFNFYGVGLLLEAQDLISRAEQKKEDIEILQKMICTTCNRESCEEKYKILKEAQEKIFNS